MKSTNCIRYWLRLALVAITGPALAWIYAVNTTWVIWYLSQGEPDQIPSIVLWLFILFGAAMFARFWTGVTIRVLKDRPATGA